MTPFLNFDFKPQHLPKARWEWIYFLQPILLIGLGIWLLAQAFRPTFDWMAPAVLALQMLGAYACSSFRWQVFKVLVEAQTLGLLLLIVWPISIPVSITYAVLRLSKVEESWLWALFPYGVSLFILPFLSLL